MFLIFKPILYTTTYMSVTQTSEFEGKQLRRNSFVSCLFNYHPYSRVLSRHTHYYCQLSFIWFQQGFPTVSCLRQECNTREHMSIQYVQGSVRSVLS